MKRIVFPIVLLSFIAINIHGQSSTKTKPISPMLFGIFFEDLSYAADGGLYAELIQNRSFEYAPSDRKNWQSLSYWDYITDGFGYGTISVESGTPVHPNNPHYVVLNVEDQGQKGVGLANQGFDGIVIRNGELYDFSIFIRNFKGDQVPVSISLRNKKGEILGETSFSTDSKEWKKYAAVIKATQSEDSARLFVLFREKGRFEIDMVSMFPQNTFQQRKNGLRNDLAQAVADLKPKFMRFPGGCLVHGDGVGNIYRWKNTIGPVEQRVEQRNIWNYHQSMGIGYFEYFQFCEDIGAIPVPVVAAAVSCQNSGGTWRIGGTGQKGIPEDQLQEYIQEVLDLIEYANGDANTTWGSKRAGAGHPGSFNLKYLGIGNEDKQTDLFRDHFRKIYDVVHAKHPEIVLIGTTGPFHSGEDYDLGWSFANQLSLPMVDEHYYEKPEWFLSNNFRYDSYDRKKSKVYVGEYASRGNALFNALAEAVYMTSLERNGDVVTMASYAPLLANQSHTSWNPNLIYFSNTRVVPTINYYVQKLFSTNTGESYYYNVVNLKGDKAANDTTSGYSCVLENKTKDLILKLINTSSVAKSASINLSGLGKYQSQANGTILAGDPNSKNTLDQPLAVLPKEFSITVKNKFDYELPPYSFVVIRIKAKK